MRRPLVSVIVRTWNRAHLLPRAMASLWGQSFSDFEAVLVDDASTDGTAAVIRGLARRDPRVVAVRRAVHSRRCVPHAEPMNDGLRVARGRFIAYLDDDVVWRPSYLEVLAGELLDDPAKALAYCDTCNHLSAEGLLRHRKIEERETDWVSPTAYVAPHLPRFRELELFPSGHGYRDYIDTNEMMHTADALHAVGGRWLPHPRAREINDAQGPEFAYRTHADLYLAERIAKERGPDALLYVPQVLTDYVGRCHPGYGDPDAVFSGPARATASR